MSVEPSPRPAEICARLLASVDASEGRRKRRARNTTPDALGLNLKRQILADAIAADPDPDLFEGWLLTWAMANGAAYGPALALCRDVLYEWQTISSSPDYQGWLEGSNEQ